jgi:transposase
MAKAHRPRRTHRYSGQFKLTAVRLSQTPGVQVKDVAEALDVHPFMLSKWRKEAREGAIAPDAPQTQPTAKRAAKPAPRNERPDATTRHELQRYAELKRRHALLKEEHELLKKVIRFCSARKATSSPSSSRSGTASASTGSAASSASAVPATTPGAPAGRRSARARTRR